MLNKDNYVSWSSRLLCYAKSKPNGKLIYNSIINGPYVRRMILEPGDPDREVPVAESFHEQTDDELTKKETKQMEGDVQAIQTILMGLPEDIYNGLIVVQGIANQNANQNGNGNVVVARAEGNGNGNNGDIDEIEKVNVNYILMANLQQASTLGIQTDKAPIYDLDGSVEVHHYKNCYDNEIFNMFTQEEQYTELLEPITKSHLVQQNTSNVIIDELSVEHNGETVEQHPATVEETADESLDKNKVLEHENERLLRAVVSQDIMSIVQNSSVVDTSNLQTELDRTSANTKFAKPSTLGKPASQPFKNQSVVRQLTAFQSKRKTSSKTRFILKVDVNNALTKPVTLHSVPNTQESKVMKNAKMIASGMFRINALQNSRVDKVVLNKPIKASVRTKLITVSQPHVITKQDVNSNSNGLSYTSVESTAKTIRPYPRSNTKNDRVPSAFKSSCIKNKEIQLEEHHRNLLLSKNKKHMSSECNNIKLAIRNDKSEVVCAICKQCLITANHDVCVLKYVNDMNSRADGQIANVLNVVQIYLWCVDSGCSKHMTGNLKLLINFVWKFMGTIRFGYDHIAAILGYGNLQLENILIARVYFVEGLGHNMFSVGQFCDSDLEVAFRKNTCFVKNLEGVDLLKGNCTTNLYTIHLHEMASASPVCLMARAISTKSWLWHQR
ncbi:hypothetical protein Tco_0091460 [Tanacetum coccineum]